MGSGVGMSAISSMLAGMILWGGIGYLADRWAGTRFLVAIGVLVGLGLGVYLVFLRFGRPEQRTDEQEMTELVTAAQGRRESLAGEEKV